MSLEEVVADKQNHEVSGKPIRRFDDDGLGPVGSYSGQHLREAWTLGNALRSVTC